MERESDLRRKYRKSTGVLSFVADQLLGIPRHIRLLLLLQFLMSLSTFTAMPLMAVHMADNLSLAAGVIGTVFTIHLALGRALPVITGPVVDRFGFRNLMVLGLLGRAAGFILFTMAAGASGAISATLLIGLGTAAYESAVYGVFGRQPDETVTRVFILNNFALNLGVVVGPALGTIFVFHDTLLPFRAAALFFVVLGIWSARFGFLDEKYTSRSPIVGSWGSVLTDLRFLWFLATTLPWWFLFAQLFVAFPLYANQITGLESSANAVFLTNGVSGLIFVAVSLFAFNWIKSREMMILCHALLFAVYCLAPASETIHWLLAVVFVYTIAESLILPSVETITAELAPDGQQATYFGALGLAWGIGAAIGSYTGSWLVLEIRSPPLIWGLYASVAALGLVLGIAFKRTEKPLRLRPFVLPGVAGDESSARARE
ncbi:MFS transporter [Sinorhizobium meliloti]|uniref:MFS transporter n=1 Tax=Rhizobium meliloti TaxID=382 RepID=UPI003F18E651